MREGKPTRPDGDARRPPPPVRDRKLDLAELHRLARTFDAIGDEIGGAHYPACAFVQRAGRRVRRRAPPAGA
jgi:hypothetical protein